MKKAYILITLLAALSSPSMAQDNSTLSVDIGDSFVTVRTPENETRTIDTFTATNIYNTDYTCQIEFKGEMETGTWRELPAGAVINNTEIKHELIKLSLTQGVDFTNNGIIDLSCDEIYFQTIEVQAGSTFINKGSVAASFNVQNDSDIIAEDGSSFGGSIRLGFLSDYQSSVGTLTLNGAVTMDLSSSLDLVNGSLIFTEGSTLDMNGGSITLGDTSSIIYQVDGTADASVRANELFRNADIGDDIAITVKGSDGTEYKTTIGALTVPEPTTATLSLLALCGLAARRRRK